MANATSPPGAARAARAARAGAGRFASPALRYAAAFYGLAIVVHGADHIRRGLDILTAEVFWAGIASGFAALAAITLAFARSRLAPSAAVGVGFTSAGGIAAVHLLPRWSPLSDPFPGAGVDAASWAVVLLEIAAALNLGFVGLYNLRRTEHFR